MGNNANGQGNGQGDGQGGCSQPGEVLPGRVTVAGLQDTGVNHDPAMWMEQGDAACPRVLAFGSQAGIASIFLNI